MPTGDVHRTDRAALLAALTAVVHAQDTEMVTAWARELSDDVPSFEDWCAAQRGTGGSCSGQMADPTE